MKIDSIYVWLIVAEILFLPVILLLQEGSKILIEVIIYYLIVIILYGIYRQL